ncbi:hypothetical protein ACFV3E_13365 [Streptomyces sp. NPDC059718]
MALDGAEALRAPAGAQAPALGRRAAVTTVIGFVCWYAGVQRIGAERATLFSGLIPVSAAPTEPLSGVGTYGTGQPAGSLLLAGGVALGAGVRHVTPGDPERAGTPALRR